MDRAESTGERRARGQRRTVSALEAAAVGTLPVVQVRRGTTIRDTADVARRLSAAAIELFTERGFDDVAIDEIANLAGVNKRTFFRYYPSKETIFLDILDQTSGELVRAIEAAEGEDLHDLLGSAVVAWGEHNAPALLSFAELAEGSETLQAVSALHSWKHEEAIAQALTRRLPGLDAYVADMAGAVALAALRIARARCLASRSDFATEVALAFAAVRFP
ncbi:MAG: TetR family transcriptional regulator [Aeromicrobium sp.]